MQRKLRLTDMIDQELQALIDDVVWYSKQQVFLTNAFGASNAETCSKTLEKAIDELVHYTNSFARGDDEWQQ